MIDQKKILGHREPYKGMGEAVGLLHLMSNPSEAKRANELKIKDQGRKEPAKRPKNRDQGIRDKSQRTRNRKDIKKHQDATRTPPHPVKYDPMLGNTKTKRVPIHRALKSNPQL